MSYIVKAVEAKRATFNAGKKTVKTPVKTPVKTKEVKGVKFYGECDYYKNYSGEYYYEHWDRIAASLWLGVESSLKICPTDQKILDNQDLQEPDDPRQFDTFRFLPLNVNKFKDHFSTLKGSGSLLAMLIGKEGKNIRALVKTISYHLGFNVTIRALTVDEATGEQEFFVCYNRDDNLTDDGFELIKFFISNEISRILGLCSENTKEWCEDINQYTYPFPHSFLVDLFIWCQNRDEHFDDGFEEVCAYFDDQFLQNDDEDQDPYIAYLKIRLNETEDYAYLDFEDRIKPTIEEDVIRWMVIGDILGERDDWKIDLGDDTRFPPNVEYRGVIYGLKRRDPLNRRLCC